MHKVNGRFYTRKGRLYTPPEIIPRIAAVLQIRSRIPRQDLDGDLIQFKSTRLAVYTKGTDCVMCGLQGRFFAKEKTHGDRSEGYHLNFYALNSQNEEVMMTRDHIYPKSLGGSDDLSNSQVMCGPCNWKKGSVVISHPPLKELVNG